MARKSRKNMMPQAAVQEAVQQNEKELLRTAAYARLSVENGGHETEDSLHTQILQIHNYIRENPELTLTDTYADNGFTGTRFDRPEFERMMQDIRTGKIQCIVVKDLSRFGRDYIETGSYLETIFPMLHVRFIAINDDFDNIRQSDVDSLAVPIKNMVNSLYAKDISKKISLSYQMRREKGIPTSWCTPYGYQLNQQGNKLEATEDAKWVKLIYQWYLAGVSTNEIARRLEFLEVARPNERLNRKLHEGDDPTYNKWHPSTVLRILNSSAYIGELVSGKTQTASYKGIGLHPVEKKEWHTDYIQAQPGWVFVGIYADEGISGTSLEHRKGMQQLIEDCKAGKIDLVLTKSIARFARNIVDCLSVIELLKNLNPPVGVKFEADNIYTLDSNGRMILTILASVAEEESHSKSIIMNWSIDRRFSRGLFLTPALLGYDKDEEGNLVINPEEAQTVKVIYYLYLNGYSLTEIATLLMEYSRKTKLGRVEWNPGTLAGVLANERHCGDVLARKTFTPNFLTHKSKKNNNDRTQYRQKNHHEAIVSREVFNAANHLRASRNYSKKNRPLPVLSVVEDGILRGYVPFDKDWTGFSAEEYREASESVMKEPDVTVTADVKKRLDLTGYEIVRVQYFSTMQNPAMTISNGRLRFNTACLKKFENVEYVELLLNSVERCIAIRPCDKNNPNAIRWGRLKEGRWCASTLGCRGLAKTLFDIMEWDEDLRYRFRGQFLEQGDNKMMLFAFDEPEMIKVEEIVLPPKENTEEDEGETVKKKIYIFPPEWAGTFGQPITSIAQVGILRQEHYAGNWDVFRPATEIEEMNIFTAESLNELLREAEKIMEGWTDYR